MSKEEHGQTVTKQIMFLNGRMYSSVRQGTRVTGKGGMRGDVPLFSRKLRKEVEHEVMKEEWK